MRRGQFSWKLFLGNAVLTTVVWGTLVWLIVRQVEAFYRDDLTRQLHTYAELVRQQVAPRLGSAAPAELDVLAKQLGAIRGADIRVTFIAPDGVVLADSDADPARLENHSDRPEVIAALAGGIGQSTRWSHSVNRELTYVALRVGSADQPDGVIRIATAVPTIGARTEASRRFIWTMALIAVLAIIAWGIGLAYLWSGPIARITAAASSLSAGDLSARAEVSGSGELARLANALNQMRDHLADQLKTIDQQRLTLDRTLQMKTDFVANASHELRTPLSAIRAAVETMQGMDVAHDPAAAARFLSIIDRHTTRLEALVNDLLNLSRAESPAAHFEPAALDPAVLCGELHERFADALQSKRLGWLVDCPPAQLVASPQLLQLVLDNLVDNAIKFTDPGGWVRITCTPSPEGIAFEVADNGCGIPALDQERVFERFYQVERARSSVGGTASSMRGTGLGLSIVRHAVTAMGGTVSLTSTPGHGTRVTVRIPQTSTRPVAPKLSVTNP